MSRVMVNPVGEARQSKSEVRCSRKLGEAETEVK